MDKVFCANEHYLFLNIYFFHFRISNLHENKLEELNNLLLN